RQRRRVWVTGSCTVDVPERFEPGTEAGRGSAYPLGGGADPAVPASQQRNDAVGLTQLLHPQHHPVVAEELIGVAGHPTILLRMSLGAALLPADLIRAQ